MVSLPERPHGLRVARTARGVERAVANDVAPGHGDRAMARSAGGSAVSAFQRETRLGVIEGVETPGRDAVATGAVGAGARGGGPRRAVGGRLGRELPGVRIGMTRGARQARIVEQEVAGARRARPAGGGAASVCRGGRSRRPSRGAAPAGRNGSSPRGRACRRIRRHGTGSQAPDRRAGQLARDARRR
jgi:hypothetical protein